MNTDRNDRVPQFLIGPESHGDSLMDEARERIRIEDEQNKEGTKLAKRLIVAFILILFLGVIFYIVLPLYGLKLDPIVPVMSFLAILIGAIMTAVEENKDSNGSDDSDDSDDEDNRSGGCCNDNNDGCAVGMCPGPRPLRMFSKPKNSK